MSGWRCLTVLGVMVGLAGCGGSGARTAASSPLQASRAVPVQSAPMATLPASSSGPTTCTVYESGFATQVVFDSQSLNVTPECAAWSSQESGDGYLWGYEGTAAVVDVTAIRICDLRDPTGRVTASVVEDTALAPVSAVERLRSAVACRSMRAAGWVVRRRS